MRKIGVIALAASLNFAPDSFADQVDVMKNRDARQVVTCENEKSLFYLMSVFAGLTSYKKITTLSGGKEVSFKTRDDITLSGLKLESKTPSDSYLLIMQGNGFPAGRLIQEFERFQKLGIDVYAYDYRGYKKSGGARRFFSMIQDYTEIINTLNSKYKNRFVYATSFGGVVAANVIQDYSDFNLVIFDSVVSKASSIVKCNRQYDPIAHLPSSCKNLVVQTNTEDRFSKGGYLTDLMEAGKKCGATVTTLGGLAHPFEESPEDIQLRMESIEKQLVSRL